MCSVRILLIEDEEALRELLVYNFSRLGFSVTALDNANDALIVLEDWPPDIILLDLMLPGLKGLQFLEILRRSDQKVPVVIISALNAETDLIAALEQGADDYITKPFSFNYLEAKMRALLRRQSQDKMAAPQIASGGLTIDIEAHKVLADGEALQLTQKEFELLALFMQRPGRVFTRNQLLNTVWGYDANLISQIGRAHV